MGIDGESGSGSQHRSLAFPSCCLLPVTASNSDLPENVDKGLGFQMITNHHLFFLAAVLSLPPSKLEVSTPAPVGRLTLRCSVHVSPECSHRIRHFSGPLFYLSLQKSPISSPPPTSLYDNSLHLLNDQLTLGQWLHFLPRKSQPRHANTKLLPSPSLPY